MQERELAENEIQRDSVCANSAFLMAETDRVWLKEQFEMTKSEQLKHNEQK